MTWNLPALALLVTDPMACRCYCKDTSLDPSKWSPTPFSIPVVSSICSDCLLFTLLFNVCLAPLDGSLMMAGILSALFPLGPNAFPRAQPPEGSQ